MSVSLSALIHVEGGVLSRDELDRMRTVLADRMMVALTDIPYLNISQIKVSR